MAAFLLTSCLRPLPAKEGGKGAELVWPQPPEQARIRWIHEIRTPEDAGIKPGFWRRLGDLAFGRQEWTMVRPYGVLADGDRLLVADTGGATLEIFDVEVGRHRRIGRELGPALLSPLGLARDDQGRFYLTDSEAGAVFRLEFAKGGLSQWVGSGLQRPTGIVFNPANGLIYVSDTASHQIVAFDPQGKEKLRIGTRGSGPGELNFPTDLAVDAQGRLTVTDALNGRIQIFSPEGELLRAFGEAGDVPGTLNKPKGVAVDSEGHIYVCDGMQDRVHIFDEAGRLLLAFGGSGRGPGEFRMPSGIWIDGRDRIYVADSLNSRIQVFQYIAEPGSGGGKSP